MLRRHDGTIARMRDARRRRLKRSSGDGSNEVKSAWQWCFHRLLHQASQGQWCRIAMVGLRRVGWADAEVGVLCCRVLMKAGGWGIGDELLWYCGTGLRKSGVEVVVSRTVTPPLMDSLLISRMVTNSECDLRIANFICAFFHAWRWIRCFKSEMLDSSWTCTSLLGESTARTAAPRTTTWSEWLPSDFRLHETYAMVQCTQDYRRISAMKSFESPLQVTTTGIMTPSLSAHFLVGASRWRKKGKFWRLGEDLHDLALSSASPPTG
jgi:hypothetical protein